MYRIIQVIVKPKKEKELCGYFKDMCENYTYLKNDANFHIRQHMTGLKKSEGERYENESESIQLFQEYIPKMCENSQAYHDKRVQNIMDNEKLSDSEKQDKIKSVKPPVIYEIPDEEYWFLDAYRIDGVFRLYEDDKPEDSEPGPYRKLPAQVNQNAIKTVCSEWKSYFKALKEYEKCPSKFLGKPKIPGYCEGLSTITLTNINCKFSFKDRKCTLSFPKTKCVLNLGKYIKGRIKLKQAEIVPVADYFKVILTTEEADVSADFKENCRVASIDIGGKNTVTLTTNVKGLKPFIITGDILKGKNDNWLSAIDVAKSELRRGLNPKDHTKPYTSKKIKKMYANRDKFLSDYFHKICLFILKYCKENNIDTLVIGRNKGQKQNLDMENGNREYYYVPFTRLYAYLSYLCKRNGINYIEIEESYTSKASFFDGDKVPTFKKGVYEEYTFSGNRTIRDIYVTKDGVRINSDVNGSLNIMRKAVPKLCGNIDIGDVMEVDILGYEFFYPPFRKTA